MFIYKAYDTTVSPPTPTDRLTAADLGTAGERIRTAKIDISFEVLPAGNTKSDFGATVQDSVFLRSADPNATSPDPTCR